MNKKKHLIALILGTIFISGCNVNSSWFSGDISGDITKDNMASHEVEEELPETAGKEFSHSDSLVIEKEDFNLEDIIDSPEISEAESLEDPVADTQIFQNTKTFGVTSTTLSLTQVEKEFKGVLTFDAVYASDYLSEENVLNSELLEQEIEKNITVAIPSGRCETNALYVDQSEEENTNGMYSSYNFDIHISCVEESNIFGISNTLFIEKGKKYAQILNILKQTETGDVWNIANTVLTPIVPVFQYGNKNQFKPFDNDGDGLLNYEEKLYGTNPDTTDTDQDGISDMDEILKGRNPLLQSE